MSPEVVLRDVRADLDAVVATLEAAGRRDVLPGLRRMAQIAADPGGDVPATLTRLAGLYQDALAVRDGFSAAYVPDHPGGWGVDRAASAELDRRRDRLTELLRPYREQR